MPGTLVAMGRNSPRISAGAGGLGLKGFRCGGPPVRENRVKRLTRPKGGGPAGREAPARSRVGSARPKVPMAPTCRNARRGIRPGRVSMSRSLAFEEGQIDVGRLRIVHRQRLLVSKFLLLLFQQRHQLLYL